MQALHRPTAVSAAAPAAAPRLRAAARPCPLRPRRLARTLRPAASYRDGREEELSAKGEPSGREQFKELASQVGGGRCGRMGFAEPE